MTTTRPKPTRQRIVCECGQTLGEVMGIVYASTYRGRVVVARQVISIQCEKCGREWTPEQVDSQEKSQVKEC